MNIHGRKVILRAFDEEDLPILLEWANDPDWYYLLGGWHLPISMESQRKWFASLQTNSSSVRFAIETPDLGLIGTANLLDIDWKNNHAWHGMILGNKDIRGKGYGTDTIMAVMRYAFEELHFERLDGGVIEYNEVSYNVYCNKCGWKEEGIRRRWYFRKNRYWDMILVGITRDDYFSMVAQNKYWENE